MDCRPSGCDALAANSDVERPIPDRRPPHESEPSLDLDLLAAMDDVRSLRGSLEDTDLGLDPQHPSDSDLSESALEPEIE